MGMVAAISGQPLLRLPSPIDTQASPARARTIVMQMERALEPIDRESDKVGYDIESPDLTIGRLRSLEVKGRVTDACITISPSCQGGLNRLAKAKLA